MTTARDIMTSDVATIDEDSTVAEAAKLLAEEDAGAVPICGTDRRLKGVLTDRDIVVQVIAEGRDPSTVKASELGQGDGETVTIGADDSIDDVLRTMSEHQVRRLPVIDGDQLVGIIAQADVAQNADSSDVGETVEDISS